jgi:signal transduction histidine kinase
MHWKHYLTLGQNWVNHIRQVPWVRSWLDRLMTPPVTAASADYEVWRQRFLWNRLGLCIQLTFAILLTFTARDLYDLLFPIKDLENLPYKNLWLPTDAWMCGLLIGFFLLHRLPFAQRYSALLFLGVSWSVTLIPQIIASLHGFPLRDTLAWSLTFVAQAVLIPVRWEIHLTSQLGLFAYFYGVNSLLGLTEFPAMPGRPPKSIFVLTTLMYLFWLCFICNLGVYLYERLQKAEFESRKQTQLFLHAVSHDLRNPVTGTILVLKNLLKKGGNEITVSRSVVERMIESSDRQLQLINSLLEVHSSDVRGIEIHPQPTDLSVLVDSVIADLEPLLHNNQATILARVSPELPLVNIDKTQIWRVFCNLIANALHHNPPGTQITIAAFPEAEMVRCQVQDDGIGMNQIECDRIFDLYTRGTQAKRTVGLGLGLYLCRQIIIAHGGEIGVTSSLNQGATFWFTVPIVLP